MYFVGLTYKKDLTVRDRPPRLLDDTRPSAPGLVERLYLDFLGHKRVVYGRPFVLLCRYGTVLETQSSEYTR